MSSDWIESELGQLDRANLRRRLRTAYRPSPGCIELEGINAVDFSSNDYLGLACDSRLVEAQAVAAWQWGSGSGASRLVSGSLPLFAELERALAGLRGTEASIVFGSGYLANIVIIPALARQGDVLFSDRLNHSSIIDGCRLSKARTIVYDHGDWEHLACLVAAQAGVGRKIIVTESVFSMDGDLAPLTRIVETAKEHGAILVVDEAHAIGVLGAQGRGALDHLQIPADSVDIVIGTLGKALGAYGAFACGRSRMVDLIVNRARSFIYSTALPPGVAGAALEALRLMRAEPDRLDRLQQNRLLMQTELSKLGVDSAKSAAAIFPVQIGEPGKAVSTAERLLEKGFFVLAFRPPTVPAGTSRLRITVSAAHTAAQIKGLGNALGEVLERS